MAKTVRELTACRFAAVFNEACGRGMTLSCWTATDGFVQVVMRDSGRVLGATIVAPRADDMIVAYVHALRRGWRLRDMAAALHPYPSYSMRTQRLAADLVTEQFLQSRTGRIGRRVAGPG